MGKLIDLTGKRFGKWLALEYVGMNKNRSSLWRCACKCGSERIVASSNLRSGQSKACGCVRKKHELSRRDYCHYLYHTWVNMKQRCSNPKATCYKHYGGRGIAVCDRWVRSFINFLADMGDKPTLSHTLERIDNDKGYFPENCKWATMIEQNQNKRNNHITLN